ncbi:hypothetical protein RCL1_006370 [Eukaryota sp. TZLM3-RCL]
MGKRKSSSAGIPTRRPQLKVPKRFDCPCCESVSCCSTSIREDQLHKRRGYIECAHCQANWSVPVSDLTSPIDVYCSWVDAAAEASKDVEVPIPTYQASVPVSSSQTSQSSAAESEEESIDVSQEPLPETDSEDDEDFDVSKPRRVIESDEESDIESD